MAAKGNPPAAVREYHTAMVKALRDLFPVNEQPWKNILLEIQTVGLLTQHDLGHVTNMFELFIRLMKRGKIRYGEYEAVYHILNYHDVAAGDKIDIYTKLINKAFKIKEKQRHSVDSTSGFEDESESIYKKGTTFSDDKMTDIILRNDVAMIKALIYDGLDLSHWKDKHRHNIYHYCAHLANHYNALCVAEVVPGLCKRHASLLIQENEERETPVEYACSMNGHLAGYNLAMIELFIQNSQNIDYEDLLSKSSDSNMTLVYLAWRKDNPTGLPKEIARFQNEALLGFITTVQDMDPSTARQYMKSIQEQSEKSHNIRIVLLGYQEVGKTTLLLRLTGQDLSALKPTNQIDVHQNIVIVDIVTEKCWLLAKEQEHAVTLSRLHDVIIEPMKSQQGVTKSDHVNETMGKELPTSPGSDDRVGAKEEPLESISEAENSTSIEQPEAALNAEAGAVMTPTDLTYLGSGKSRAYVSIFDFGGEIMFSNFQHIFLNTNNVILLCFSLHNVFKEDKIRDRIYFWLNFLSTFDDEDKKYCPPVVLVGTHLDMVPEHEQNGIKDRVKSQLLKEEKHVKAFERHVLAFEVVANGEDEIKKSIGQLDKSPCRQIINNQQHVAIWKQILAAAKHQSQWNQLLPAKWILLERELMILKGQGIKVMTLGAVKARAKQLSVPLEDDDVIAMLRYLHGTRSILCFQMDHPDDEIVLDIKFIIDAFRSIVTDLKFLNEKTNINPSLQQEYGQPRVTMAFIHAVWKHGSEFHPFIETLLFYLERLELIVKPLAKKEETSVDYYIVPYLLDEAVPSRIRGMLQEEGEMKSVTLCFDFQGRFIPPAVYNKILASCIHRFALFAKEDSEREMYLQQGLGCFVLSPYWKMILHCKDSRMKITLFSNKVTEIKAGDGHSIRCLMEAILESTLARNRQGHMKFKYFISTDFEVTGSEEMVLIDFPTGESSLVDAEAAVWCPVQDNAQHHSNVSSNVNEQCLTIKQMSHVAKFIGVDYTMLFSELNMSKEEIDQIAEPFRECYRTLATYLLRAWSNKFGEKAVVGLLLSTMVDLGYKKEDILGHLNEMNKTETRLTTTADDRCPTDVERNIIAKKIPASYVIFFIELGLDTETIDRARMDYKTSLVRFIELLNQWARMFGKKATLAKIYEAAKECSMNLAELQMEIQKQKK